MDKMIGCCGIDCSRCDAYLATVNDDDDLRKRTAELWSRLNRTEIRPEDINCEGCRADGVKTVFCDSLCEVRKCAAERDLETCADCIELMTCPRVGAIHSGAPEALENLKR